MGNQGTEWGDDGNAGNQGGNAGNLGGNAGNRGGKCGEYNWNRKFIKSNSLFLQRLEKMKKQN